MDIESVYKQLTDVDIEEQKQIWDERGKGYYGEYLVFCELYKSITGNGKILMNLNLPAGDDATTEIDLLLIHETGLYVFEIKHYKGTIYGKDTDEIWTQYFRTVKNNTFKNPIEQNGYHLRALKKLYPKAPIFSCVVFANKECDLRIENTNESIVVCQLGDVKNILDRRFAEKSRCFSMKDIDDIFANLSSYSPMKDCATIDGVEADLQSWIQPMINNLEKAKAEVEVLKNNWKSSIEELKKSKRKGFVINALIAIVTIVVAVTISRGVIQEKDDQLKKNSEELAKFKQNFLHIDEIDNEYIDALHSYVEVSKISLEPLSDDAVSFSARIAVTNDIYGIALTENSKYIVMTKTGKVYEYDVFGEHLKYNKYGNMIGKGIRAYGDLASVQFFGISDSKDVTYIKVTGINLFKAAKSSVVIKDDLEIELYSAQSD